MSEIVLHLLIVFDYILQRSCNLSSSKVSIKGFYFFDSLFKVLIIVDNTVLEHALKVTAKTDDVIYRVFG
jgi:hypothetical protein